MKLSIVIPAFNEEAIISTVLQEVFALDLEGFEKEVIVIDDGSTDRTAEIARSKGSRVIQHLVNRGLGGALGTGIEAALKGGADVIVTCDADGQHSSSDIKKVADPIIAGSADVVIGSRMLHGGQMPRMRWIANHLANYVTLFLSGIKTSDSQSGLRAFSRSAASRIKISTNHFEVSSEIFDEIKRCRLRLTEVPITAIYTTYSLSKGQGFRMGLKTLFQLFLSRWVR